MTNDHRNYEERGNPTSGGSFRRGDPTRDPVVIVMCMILMLVTVACASTKVADQEQLVTGQIPRPGQIWVYDFAATAADLPANSQLASQASENTAEQTAEHIEHGRKLGALIATALVEKIRATGMPAEHGVSGRTPQIDDLVIRGYLVSFDEGDATKRVGIGLGKGSSELKAAMVASASIWKKPASNDMSPGSFNTP